MKHTRSVAWLVSAAALAVLTSSAIGAPTSDRPFFTTKPQAEPNRDERSQPPTGPGTQYLSCDGPISRVLDVAYEDVKVTHAVYGSNPGGGEGNQFDPSPVLSTKVVIGGGCLDAHFSAIVGSKQTYGPWVSPLSNLALFQVTLRRLPISSPPSHMVGHYTTPYGFTPSSPAIALEAERDVDMVGANFFQKFGNGPHELPPGPYQVDVWWAGAPPGPPSSGGVIGADFVLKLYFR